MSNATMSQYLQLGKMIQNGALTREFVQAVLEGRVEVRPVAASGPYLVSVDRSLTLVQMIEAGGYDDHKDAVESITETRFPVDRSGSLQCEKDLFLVPPSRDGITTTEWKAELEANGWELEQTPELLALGAKHPDLQREHFIIAFGSSWRNPDGDLYSPVLWGDRGERRADAGWDDPDYRWCLHDRSLVSRKRR